jgi:uncharacterized protein YjdB
MTYKYTPILAQMFPDPKSTVNQDILAGINAGFYTSYDWFTIQEETTRGLGICDRDVDVRINHVISAFTGDNEGDDWKKLSFNGIKDLHMGDFFAFSNNYWVVVNVENIKSPTSTCTVRRCNNVLRWMASDGSLYQYPCALGYKIARNKNLESSGAAFPRLEGILVATTQHNASTATIQPNQRFLFGNPSNWVAYMVQGGGLVNFQNLQTTSNTSYGILELDIQAVAENAETDDFTNGIADVNKFVYDISIAPSSFGGIVGDSITLVPTVTLNDEVVTRTVTWSSSNAKKATVDATTGIVTLVAVGNATITGELANNSTVSQDVVITIAATPPADTYSFEISPTTNYILQGNDETYTVKLLKNGVDQSATFTFTVDSSSTAPTSSYEFTVMGIDSFKVENLAMSLGAPLIISAVSGTHNELITILLKGAF